MWRVSTRIFNFSRYGRSPMCGLLRPRTNEGLKVKEVNVIWMNTWGILNRTNNITRSWFFPFLYICIIHTIFSFKRKHNCDNRQTKNKTNTTKNVQKCGGQVAPNNIWLGPSNKTKYFFFFFHRRTRVSPLRLHGCTNFNQMGFPPKLAADEQPQKCFFGIVLIRTFI